MAEEMAPEVVHIASHPVMINSTIRQRCVWCGVELLDIDLRYIAVQSDQADKPYPTWPTDAFIGKSAGATYVVESPPDNKLPPSFCGAVPDFPPDADSEALDG